jgi:hypothetical protein
LVAALIAAKLLLTAGGNPPVPPLAGAVRVTQNLLRGGQPDDFDLASMAKQYRVRAVVNISGPSVAERAVSQALHQGYLESPVAAGAAPSWPQLATIAEFVHRYTAKNQLVYLHDDNGGGRALATTRMLLLLRGQPLQQVVPATRGYEQSMSSQQVLDVFELAAALISGHRVRRTSQNPYADAHLVRW